MTTSDTKLPAHAADHDAKSGPAIGAIFQSRDAARSAIAALHKNHFTHTWTGVTSLAVKDGDQVVAIEAPGFLSLKSQNLVDALVEHGVQAQTATGIEPAITAGETIVTVRPGDRNPSEAQKLLQDAGGELLETAVTRGPLRSGAHKTSTAGFSGPSDDDAVYVEEIFYFTNRN
jgi:hypothetical protein